MKIHVRRRHIEKGKPRDFWACPIALAFMERAGRSCSVDECHIVDGIKNRPLPSQARRFISRFDAGKPVKPFAFVLK